MSTTHLGKVELQSRTLRKITLKYSLAVSLMGVFAIVAFILNQSQHRMVEEDFKIINLSGRQRMLSQRIALLSNRNDSIALANSIKEFTDGHLYLLSTRFLHKDYAAIYNLYYGKAGINKMMRQFIPLVNKDLHTPENQTKIFTLSQKLLFSYDQATLLKQLISESEYQQRHRIEAFILAASLVLLVLAIIFIFKPMTDEVAATFRELNLIEEKALENARLAMIGEASTSIGHEISNPLTVISASAESIIRFSDQSMDHKVLDKLNSIIRHSKKISRILYSLKTQARLTSHDPMSTSSLSEIVHDALEMFEGKMEQQGIDFELIESERVEVVCRKSAISQVVANLLSNAIDALSNVSGEKKIKVEIVKIANQSILRLSDSGHGVPEQLEEKIFESFITTKAEGKGTGLGLAISRKIMEDHGGELRLNTLLSRSTFEMVFYQDVSS